MPNPSKTFFYSKVYQNIKKYRFYSVLDVGCGNCQFYPIFKKNYLGVDIDLKKIRLVKKIYPECKIIYSNFLKINIKNFYDLVLCLEVNSLNNKVKPKNSIKVFKKLLKLPSKNGILMINFWKDFAYQNINKIEQLILKNNFKIIKKIEYGFFDKYFNFIWWKILHHFYYLFLFFNKFKKKRNIFYVLRRN